MPGNLRFARCQFLRENRKMRLSENEPSGISGRLFCGIGKKNNRTSRGDKANKYLGGMKDGKKIIYV